MSPKSALENSAFPLGERRGAPSKRSQPLSYEARSPQSTLQTKQTLLLQQDLLLRLGRSSIKPERYEGFQVCDMHRCGRPGNCKEACLLGSLRRSGDAMPNILRLFANEMNLFEVQVSRVLDQLFEGVKPFHDHCRTSAQQTRLG